MNTGGLGVFELVLGLVESLLDAGLGLGSSAAQTSLEGLGGGRGDEDVACGDAGLLNLLDTLF